MYLFQMSFVYFIKKCIESKVNCGILSILFCTTEHQRVALQDHDTWCSLFTATSCPWARISTYVFKVLHHCMHIFITSKPVARLKPVTLCGLVHIKLLGCLEPVRLMCKLLQVNTMTVIQKTCCWIPHMAQWLGTLSTLWPPSYPHLKTKFKTTVCVWFLIDKSQLKYCIFKCTRETMRFAELR